MLSASRVKIVSIVLATALAFSLTACSGTADGEDSEFPTLDLQVASSTFSEPWILSEMVKIFLEDLGHNVEHTINIQADTSHALMSAGELDFYMSWTGTEFTGLLEMDVTEEWRDRERVFDYVHERLEEDYDRTLFPPLGFNNTYALAVRQSFAEEHGLEKASDLIDMAPDLTIGTDTTFQERSGDGFDAMAEHYGFEFGEVVGMTYGILYRAVASGDVDVSVAYSTDGRIPAMDLVILQDDRNFFPPYDGVIIGRNETLEADPRIAETLSVMWGAIDEATMARLNAEVDVEEREFADVAREFMQENGWIE